ncbi:MAG: M4 family metallopeptidase [Lachnospiraceae bacterium]|nr:M4 family metallopeptidase [Candidatus Merdinaster equi]
MKRRILFAVLISLCVMLFAGCGDDNGNTSLPDNESAADEQGDEGESSKDVADENEAATNEENYQVATLEELAAINGITVDELNIYKAEDGTIRFIGNKISNRVVSSEADVVKAIGDISELLSVKDNDFVLTNKQTSPVSGNTTYTFSVAKVYTIDGEEVGVSTNRCISLMVNKEGEIRALTNSLYPENEDLFGTYEIVTKEAAVAMVREKISSEAKIYEEKIVLSGIQDESLKNYFGGTTVPAWYIYTDNLSNEKKPYMLYCVAAVSDEMTRQMDDGVISVYTVEIPSLTYFEDRAKNGESTYTTSGFFEDYEAAGVYKYTLDLSLIKEHASSPTPFGTREETMEVEVPVMKHKETGLYYLGDIDRRVIASNCFDMLFCEKTNLVCSENPEDINSWRFENTESPNGTSYFFDPNYVISSYNSMLTVRDTFYDLYGYTSTDFTELPIAVLVYMCVTPSYPEELDQFRVNASNGGVVNDWAIFLTSPTCPVYLDADAFCHEYGHGMNNRIKTLNPGNESGAINEGYGDILGVLATYIRNGIENPAEWNVGGDNAMRSMSDPYKFEDPKYIGGTYFVPEVSMNYRSQGVVDSGGVHDNANVLNYLCYKMVNSDTNTALTMKEDLDLWLEALYCISSDAGYKDIGHYLKYAATQIGLSDEKQSLVNELVDKYGFGDGNDSLSDIFAEEGTVKLTFEVEGEYGEELSDLVLLFNPDGGGQYQVGQLNDGKATYRAKEAPSEGKLMLLFYPYDSQTYMISDFKFEAKDPTSDFRVTIKKQDVEVGDIIDIAENELCYIEIYSETAGIYESENDLTVKDSDAVYYISTRSMENEGEFTLYIVNAK